MAEQLYRLLMVTGPSPSKEYKLPQGEISIGRETNNVFVIDDPGISRRHARLRFFNGNYILVDLGSTNGTYVNDNRLVGEVALEPGDTISLGPNVVLVFEPIQVRADATVVMPARPTLPLRDEPASSSEVKAIESTLKAEEHRALFARWFEELWNKKNYTITQELVDPEFVAHGAGGQDIKQGPNGVADMVRVWHAAFPDGRMTMDDILTEGEYSVIRMTFRGTHLGDFYGTPASGKPISVTSIGIDRVVDGKITEGWGELDMLGMMQQMSPAPAPAPQQSQMFEIEAAVTPEHVKEAYAALASGDINRIRMYWADDMVWQVPGHNRLSGWYYSLDEFLAFMGQVGELSGRSFNMGLIAGEVLVTGDYSVDLTRNRGSRANQPGKTMDIEVAHVLRWLHGKVIAGKGAIFGDGTEEYDQFWSESPAVTPPTH